MSGGGPPPQVPRSPGQPPGYSSIGYLRHLPVDILKIDRTFVAGTAAGGPDNALLEAVVAMAQRLGLDVIQEGIGKIDQLSRLRAMDCRLGQGHLLSVAVSAEAIEPLLAVPTPFPHIGLYQPDSPAQLAWADGAIRPRAST